MTCDESREQLDALVDRELPWTVAWRVRTHTWFCKECARALADTRRLSREARSYRRIKAPPGLREQIIRAAHAEGVATAPSPVQWRRGRARTVRRGLLLGTAVLAVGVAAGLFATKSPADEMRKVLDAMALVSSAHAMGHRTRYEPSRLGGPSIPTTRAVDYWYKSPNRLRQSLGPGPAGSAAPAQDLITDGATDRVVTHFPHMPAQVIEVDPKLAKEGLSPFDFFSREGFIQHAYRTSRARVQSTWGYVRQAHVRVVTLDISGTTTRQHWAIQVDPVSDRVLTSKRSVEERNGSGWRLRSMDVLDPFEYDVSIPDGLFTPRTQAEAEGVPPLSGGTRGGNLR